MDSVQSELKQLYVFTYSADTNTRALLWCCYSSGKIDTLVWNSEASRKCLQCISAEFVLDIFELYTFELDTLKRRKCFSHSIFIARYRKTPHRYSQVSCRVIRGMFQNLLPIQIAFLRLRYCVQHFDSSLSNLTDSDPSKH